MPRIYRIFSIALLCAALAAPAASAQQRGRNNGGGEPARTHSTTTANRSTQQRASRPAQQPKQQVQNAGAKKGSPAQGMHATPAQQRPGNNGGGGVGQGGQRPGNNGYGNGGQRPGNNGYGQGAQRPGQGNGGAPGQGGAQQRPGQGGTVPGGGHQPAHQPGHQPVPSGPGHGGPGHPGPGFGHHGPVHGFDHFYRPPVRPMLPPPRPYVRPVPPPRFVPVPVQMFNTILGLTLGTALNVSLGTLVNNGYTIDAYANDAIYLNNVYQLNMLWPNATLFYTNGMLGASEFVYSTPYYDSARYNQAFGMLVNSFGAPIDSQMYADGGMSASWWGNGGRYVTLHFGPQRSANGSLRYYTTLSFGI